MMQSRLMNALEHLEKENLLTRAETRIVYHSVNNQAGGKEILELVKFKKESE